MLLSHFYEVYTLLSLGKVEASLRYPFGTEQGFSYESYEVYLAVSILFSTIFMQSIFAGINFHFKEMKICSLVSLSFGCLVLLLLNMLEL